MFTRSASVLIDRPQAEVFAFVADARNRPRWDESVDSEELTLLWEVSDGEDGTTRAEFSLTGRPSGLLRLLQPLIARNTQRTLDEAFPRLKQVLEG